MSKQKRKIKSIISLILIMISCLMMSSRIFAQGEIGWGLNENDSVNVLTLGEETGDDYNIITNDNVLVNGPLFNTPRDISSNDVEIKSSKITDGVVSSPVDEEGKFSSSGFTPSSEYPFSMDSDLALPAIYPGQYFPIEFKMTNIYTDSLWIKEVVLESSGEFPFASGVTRIKGRVTRDFYDDSKAAILFDSLRIKEDIKDGTYTLNFTIRFSDGAKGEGSGVYEQKLSFDLQVVGNPDNKENTRVLLSLAPLPTQIGTYGQRIDLQFGLLNRGYDYVDIISVSPKISGDKEAWPFEIENSDYTVPLGTRLNPLPSGAQTGNTSSGTLVLANFTGLLLRQDLTSGPKKVDFVVKHKYGNQEIQESEFSIYVNVAGNPEEDSKANGDADKSWPQSKPRLMCTGYTTNPEKLLGGEDFTLSLQLKNTSTLTGIQNIRMEISSDPVGENGSQPFLMESGASSVFIPYIDADSEYVLDIQMTASAQVPQKIYPLKLNMEYEDWQASAINAVEAISIHLSQAVRMDNGKIDLMPESINVGQETNLMFPLYNKGKTTLYNVTISVPEGQGISAPENFLGNLEAGSTKQVDMMLTANESFNEGEPRKLLVTYEDENGNKDHKEIEFGMSVMEEMSMDEFGDIEGIMPPDYEIMPPEGEMMTEGNIIDMIPLWAWILIVVFLLIIIIIIINSIRKSRKQRQRKLEDEAYFKDLMG